MFKCRPAHKCHNLYALCLARDTHTATSWKLQAAAQIVAVVAGCQLSQNGHKTFTIYHALLRTILATFGACVLGKGNRCQSRSLSRTYTPPRPASLSLSFAVRAAAATFCEARNLHMYSTTTRTTTGATLCVYLAKADWAFALQLDSGCLPCAREDIRCPRDVCVICTAKTCVVLAAVAIYQHDLNIF